ncbi:unnamed protein product, partial [Iphiclides podalirius]
MVIHYFLDLQSQPSQGAAFVQATHKVNKAARRILSSAWPPSSCGELCERGARSVSRNYRGVAKRKTPCG